MHKMLIILSLIILTLNISISSESHISYIEGSVTILRGSIELSGEFGLVLKKNDVIHTGNNSLAILELEERGTVKLREGTQLVLDDLGENLTVSLKSGGLFSRIKKILGFGYEVRTVSTVAGVRGTEFFMAYGRQVEETQDLWLCVNEGSVEVSIQETMESILVKEGEGITIPAGKRLTKPRYYRWTEDLNWNTDPDQGELFDNTDLNAAYADLRDFDYD